MAQPDENNRERLGDSFSRQLWQGCRTMDAAEDDAARFLDLAAYAEGRLDSDDEERVAAMLAADPGAVADIAAARAFAGPAEAFAPVDERMIERAAALVQPTEAQRSRVIAFRVAGPHRRNLHGVARWGSLAAAIVLACWLGFAMGADATLALGPSNRAGGEDALLPDLLDSSTGFLSNLTDGPQT